MWPGRTIASRRLEVALAALVLAVVAPVVATMTAQAASRYLLTAAIVEQGTVALDDYETVLGVDRVELDGRIYSDKAPGQPYLGVPVLWVANRLGADEASAFKVESNLGLWSQTLVFCAIPAAVLAVLILRHTRRSGASITISVLTAVALVGATSVLPLAGNLYGHVFAGALAFGAWHMITGDRRSMRWILGAGTLSALSVVVEFPLAVVALAMTTWLWRQRSLRAAGVFVAPHVLGGLFVLANNLAVYGSIRTGYATKPENHFIDVPKPSNVVQMVGGTQGLVFTPVVLVAVVGLVQCWKRRRSLLVVPAVSFGVFFLVQAGWDNPWGGSGPGPRYLMPAFPFLCLPLAHAFPRMRASSRAVAIAVGVVSMGLVLYTYHLLPPGGLLVETHLRHLVEDGPNPTIFTMSVGPMGWLLHGLLAGGAAWWLCRAARERQLAENEARSPRPLSAAGP